MTTQPIFLYYAAPGSCINQQMIAVINPNSSVSLATQKQDAAESVYQLASGESFPSEEGTPDGDGGPPASNFTSAASTSTKSPTHSSHSSAGAIARIVIAVIFVVAPIGALLIGCRKILQQFTRVQRQAGYQGSDPPINPMPEAGMVSKSYYHPDRDTKNSFRFPSPPLSKPGFPPPYIQLSQAPIHNEPDSGHTVSPYLPRALSRAPGPRSVHIARLTGRTENRGGFGAIPRSSSRQSRPGTVGSKGGIQRLPPLTCPAISDCHWIRNNRTAAPGAFIRTSEAAVTLNLELQLMAQNAVVPERKRRPQ